MPAQTPEPEKLDIGFTAPIEKDGAFPTYLTVPNSTELLGTGRAVKVGGTIDDHAFHATLMPSGEGTHWLPLRRSICQAIGQDQAGTEVTVRLTARYS